MFEVDSAKTRRKWWLDWFNSAEKDGFWAQIGRNALQYISNRVKLSGSLLLLVHIDSNSQKSVWGVLGISVDFSENQVEEKNLKAAKGLESISRFKIFNLFYWHKKIEN